MKCLILLAAVLLAWIGSPAVGAERLDMQSVNGAQLTASTASKSSLSPTVIKAQVLLDRARFSPGEIDGKQGDNFKKALNAFATAHDLQPTEKLNEKVWNELNSSDNQEPVLVAYTVSDDDVRGPFLAKLPKKMEEMKDLPHLGYTSAREKIAEKFHMSEALLSALNAGEPFDTAGHQIVVADVEGDELPAKVARIDVNKTSQMVTAYGADNQVLAVYPATVGSTDKPAPTGRLTVRKVSKDPTYHYNPKYAFKGVHTNKPFTIKPGPNNPVGLVWIALSGEGYGIHGTPDPSKISKSQSHGCVRLTNWDALHLAAAVHKGVVVDFFGDEQARAQAGGKEHKRLKKRH
jgi:lipoprotein-anchoring transpeptidase ErfK/SrfK